MLNSLQLKIYQFKIYFGVKSQEVLVVKNLSANLGDIRDTGLIPRSGRYPGEGHGNPLQYCCLKNPMDGGVWWVTVHRVTKIWTGLKWLTTHARA